MDIKIKERVMEQVFKDFKTDVFMAFCKHSKPRPYSKTLWNYLKLIEPDIFNLVMTNVPDNVLDILGDMKLVDNTIVLPPRNYNNKMYILTYNKGFKPYVLKHTLDLKNIKKDYYKFIDNIFVPGEYIYIESENIHEIRLTKDRTRLISILFEIDENACDFSSVEYNRLMYDHNKLQARFMNIKNVQDFYRDKYTYNKCIKQLKKTFLCSHFQCDANGQDLIRLFLLIYGNGIPSYAEKLNIKNCIQYFIIYNLIVDMQIFNMSINTKWISGLRDTIVKLYENYLMYGIKVEPHMCFRELEHNIIEPKIIDRTEKTFTKKDIEEISEHIRGFKNISTYNSVDSIDKYNPLVFVILHVNEVEYIQNNSIKISVKDGNNKLTYLYIENFITFNDQQMDCMVCSYVLNIMTNSTIVVTGPSVTSSRKYEDNYVLFTTLQSVYVYKTDILYDYSFIYKISYDLFMKGLVEIMVTNHRAYKLYNSLKLTALIYEKKINKELFVQIMETLINNMYEDLDILFSVNVIFLSMHHANSVFGYIPVAKFNGYVDIYKRRFLELLNLYYGKYNTKDLTKAINKNYVDKVMNICADQVYNIGDSKDMCPICRTCWDDEIIVVVIKCNHAYCIECIFQLIEFNQCSICRKELSSNLVDIIVDQLLKKNLLDFIKLYQDIFNIADDQYKNILSQLFIHYKADIPQISDVLFNMIGLVHANNNIHIPNAEEKSLVFEEYRKPVKMLQNQINKMRRLNDTNAAEELTKKMERVKMDAARNIFASINYYDQQKEDGVYIDLHSLYIEEAKKIIYEFVIPVLPLQKVHIITGKGNHNIHKTSPLKTAVMKFLSSNNIKYKECHTNKGVLLCWL